MKLSAAFLGLATLAVPASANDPEPVTKLIEWSMRRVMTLKTRKMKVKVSSEGNTSSLVAVLGSCRLLAGTSAVDPLSALVL
jgi:hypothetical protein